MSEILTENQNTEETQESAVDSTTQSSQVDDTQAAATPDMGAAEPTEAVASTEETTGGVTQEQLDEIQRQLEVSNKKAEDFQKGMDKWKTIAKELKTQKAEPSYVDPAGLEDWERLDQMLDEKLASVREIAEKQERTEAIEEIADMPYSKELGPEIQSKMQEITVDPLLGNLPFRKQLEIARSQAIADNASLIAEINKASGMQEAYSHQQVKRTVAQAPTTSSTSQVQEKAQDLLSRIGSMSREEYAEKKSEIDALMRENLNIR
jgi:hypothetical protein